MGFDINVSEILNRRTLTSVADSDKESITPALIYGVHTGKWIRSNFCRPKAKVNGYEIIAVKSKEEPCCRSSKWTFLRMFEDGLINARPNKETNNLGE